MLTTLELTIRHLPDGSHMADAKLTSDASAAPSQPASNVPVTLDNTALLAVESDPTAYGRALGAQLFAETRLRDAWLKSRAYAATGDLQLRLNLDAGDAALHELCWERLRDPESDQPIALHERVRLARTLDSTDLAPVIIPPRPELRALIIVSNPSDLAGFGLAEVDVEGEVGRACAALGDIPATMLADHAESRGRATLANITAALRDAPPIVILVAHGMISDAIPYIWLEQDDGTADRIAGDTFVETVHRLSSRPLLLVLASCRSAGGGYGDTLSALGPRLVGVGVPAVLAFQGDVAISTVKTLLPTLIAELHRDGQIDRALAAARAALGEQRPWWQAVLWLRTDGRLWEEVSIPTLPNESNFAYDQLSLEAWAIALLCTVVGIVLGIGMPFPGDGLSGGLLGIVIGYLLAVAYIGKTREDRRKFAFYITRLEFSHLFEERIRAVLARQGYVAPADLDDLKYTYNLDDDHLTYPMADYAEKRPAEVQYAYLYDKHTRQPIAYKRGTRNRALTPVKVLIDTTKTASEEYIVTSYPLLL